ncbi:type III pantothenate kinase [Candidatus Thioglobus sp.]|nr:type III pantothenate kinase [Candidatus Thioglobus sp.]
MSQSKIFIDIGNSAVKWRTKESNVYFESVDKFLSNSLPQADSAWVSAVANLNIVDDIKILFKEFYLVSSQKKCKNLVVAYDNPSSLGSDRFCAMLGSMNQFSKKPLLVIDIGSAMTFDVIDVDGYHQGGLIMPGLGVLRKSFSKFETSDVSTSINTLATNTIDAWKNGTQAMLISSINDQIEKFNEIYSDGIVTLCGGFVEEIKKELPNSVQIFDNLVLDGLECYSQTVG